MESDIEQRHIRNRIHWILAHSYVMYFVLFLVGVSLDMTFKLRIFKSAFAMPVGFALLIFATVLIFWAQHTTRNLEKENISKETFCRGPYCYTRTPTHWGLFLLMIGFGIIANAFFVVLSTVVSLILTRFIFVRKQEEALVQKYGAPYLEYKKMVKF